MYKITTLTIPGSIKTIGDYTFKDSKGLSKVTLKNGVKKIGRLTFAGCPKLASVILPNSVTSIDPVAFGVFNPKTYLYYSNNKKVVLRSSTNAYTFAKNYGIQHASYTFAASVSVPKKTVSLKQGKKTTLKPVVATASTNNKGGSYTSSNTKVATVNSKGLVTAKKPGKATITITTKDGSEKKTKVTITVKK